MTKVSEFVEAKNLQYKKIMNMSNRALSSLRKFDTTNEISMYLANICVEFDSDYGLGSGLTFDWFIDQYFAMEFNRNVEPRLIEIYDTLKADRHDNLNKFKHFNNRVAYYIPHERMQIMVMGNHDGVKNLVIRESVGILPKPWTKVYVRTIWPRLRKNCIGSIDRPTLSYYSDRNFNMGFANDGCLYGDSRDPGHVMTYEDVLGRKSCDNVSWDPRAPMMWFFDVGCLHTELV